MKKKRILLVTQPACGGAERVTVLYGKILEKSGFDVDILLLQLKRLKGEDSLSCFIPKEWKKYFVCSRYKYFIFHLYKCIRKTNPDIVFSSMGGFSSMLLLLKKLHLISCKVVIRDNNMPSTHGKYERRFARNLYGSADALIAQTQEMKDEMLTTYGLKDSDVTVINNPIDKDLILNMIKDSVELEPGHVNFMVCSRIAPQKDFVTMLNAFAIVKRNLSNARLYIIGRNGADEYMNKLHQIIEDKGLHDDVVFLGFQANPYKFLKHADVFVLSSVYEGLPNAMIDAMFLGIPVAATHCIPYISQVIKDDVNGYSCDCKDERGLADCMLKSSRIDGIPRHIDVNESDKNVLKIFCSL